MGNKYLNLAKKALKKIKDPYWLAKQKYIKYYDTLPTDEHTILLESEHGKKLNGNIFYIAQYLNSNEAYKDYTVYISSWVRYMDQMRNTLDAHGMDDVHITLYSSDEYYRLLASAKYLVNDTSFGSYYIKKEGQVYLNTWHGTPLKAMGRRTANEKNMIGNIQKNFVVSDFILFPNEHTRDVMMRDYMLDNLTSAKEVFCGYPRNTIFFDSERQNAIRQELNPKAKKLYAYLPTFRGKSNIGATNKTNAYLQYYLYELDRQLTDEELLYVNLHPLAKNVIDFTGFRHIREFPSEYETYEMLSICDVLITDYSSVFFDFASSGQKIVLFTYDYEEYMEDRGMYLSLEEFPFPRVFDIEQLLAELRSPKQYDDTDFLRTFAPYESNDSTEKLVNLLLTGKTDGLRIEEPRRNGKENVLIHAGSLRLNGITSALNNLVKTLDPEKRNYYITFKYKKSADQGFWLSKLPENIYYFPMVGDLDQTIRDRIIRALFKAKLLSASTYISLCRKRLRQNQQRLFGDVKFKTVIDFNGYEKETILLFSLFDAERVIYVHSDMVSEIKTRGNQRMDILAYAYRHYDKVAVVGQNLIDPTSEIKGSRENIEICHNIIDYKTVLEKSLLPLQLDEETRVFPNRDSFDDIISSDKKKFISVGRFSPEKGHKRLISAFKRYLEISPDCYLIIIGGNSWRNNYQELICYVEKMHLEDHVCLLLQVSNPFPVLKGCDGFILSSFYEGVPVVITEATIVGLPVVTTDIAGTHDIMSAHGGTLVENSEDGLYQGFCMLGDGKIPRMNVNYEQYNREAVEEFEALFEK